MATARLDRPGTAPSLDRPGARAALPFGPVVLGALLAAAAALRLYRLDAGLWLDEILTYVTYVRPPFGEILTTYDSQNQHPVFTLLAHASIAVFGDSTWALRLPAVLFGVGSIWALFVLGRYVAGEREALVAAALLTVSYHHIWFSQNARGYTGLLFWTLLTGWLLLRALDTGRRGLWVLYAAATALGVYTHMTMLFVAAGHFAVYGGTLLARRWEGWPQRWQGLFYGFVPSGLLTLLLHAAVLPQILGSAIHEESTVPDWKNPLWTLAELLRGLRIGLAGGLAGLGAACVFGAGLWSYWRRRPAVVGLLVVPVLLSAVVNVLLGHHLWPRFFFFASGLAVLVAVRGITVLAGVLAGWLRRRDLQPALEWGFAGGLVLTSALAVPFVYGPKQDYGGARTYVDTQRRPGDAVVMAGLATFPYRALYQTGWEEVASPQALTAVRARSDRTWVVYTLPVHLQAVQPEMMGQIEREFVPVRQFGGTLNGGTVYVALAENRSPRS